MGKKLKKTSSSVHLWGISLFGRKQPELLVELEATLKHSTKTTYINTPNPEQIIQSRGNTQFLADLQAADISLPDGVGLLWASRVLKAVGQLDRALPERIAGSDFAVQLLQLAQERNWRVLVMGGQQYQDGQWQLQFVQPVTMTQEYATSNLWQLASSPEVWWSPGYDQVAEPSPAEEQLVTEAIASLKPDVVFVAFGAPHQERWVVSHLPLLQKHQVKVAMVVGGAFDVFLAKVPAVPQVAKRFHLEWLFRLLSQPWRWRRQLRLVDFVGLVLTTAVGLTPNAAQPKNPPAQN